MFQPSVLPLSNLFSKIISSENSPLSFGETGKLAATFLGLAFAQHAAMRNIAKKLVFFMSKFFCLYIRL